MKSIRALLCLCGSFLTATSLVAQPASAPAKTTFRLIAAQGTYQDLYYDVSPKQSRVPVTFGRALSAPYEAPKAAKLILYRELAPLPTAPAGSGPTKQVVLEAQIPVPGTDCIIVTAPSGSGPQATLASRVIPEPPGSHPAGTIRFVNFSEYPLVAKVANQQISVPVGEITSARANAGRVFFQAAVQRDGRWQPTFRAERRLHPSLRGYFFVFNYRDDPDSAPDPTPPPARVVDIFETVEPTSR